MCATVSLEPIFRRLVEYRCFFCRKLMKSTPACAQVPGGDCVHLQGPVRGRVGGGALALHQGRNRGDRSQEQVTGGGVPVGVRSLAMRFWGAAATATRCCCGGCCCRGDRCLTYGSSSNVWITSCQSFPDCVHRVLRGVDCSAGSSPVHGSGRERARLCPGGSLETPASRCCCAIAMVWWESFGKAGNQKAPARSPELMFYLNSITHPATRQINISVLLGN